MSRYPEIDQIVYNHLPDIEEQRHRLLGSMEYGQENIFPYCQNHYVQTVTNVGLTVCHEAIAVIEGVPPAANLWCLPNRAASRQAVLDLLQSEREMRLNELERRFGELTPAEKRSGYRSALERLHKDGPVEQLAAARRQRHASSVEKFTRPDWPVMDDILRSHARATTIDKNIFGAVIMPQTAGEQQAMQLALSNYVPNTNHL